MRLALAQWLAALGFWLIRLARSIGHNPDEGTIDDPYPSTIVVTGDSAIKDEASTIHFNRKRPWQ